MNVLAKVVGLLLWGWVRHCPSPSLQLQCRSHAHCSSSCRSHPCSMSMQLVLLLLPLWRLCHLTLQQQHGEAAAAVTGCCSVNCL